MPKTPTAAAVDLPLIKQASTHAQGHLFGAIALLSSTSLALTGAGVHNDLAADLKKCASSCVEALKRARSTRDPIARARIKAHALSAAHSVISETAAALTDSEHLTITGLGLAGLSYKAVADGLLRLIDTELEIAAA